jgi:hypothetical protein
MSPPAAFQTLTRDEIIALRKETTSRSTEPWSDTLAFAEALCKALAAKNAVTAGADDHWETLDALGWQRVECEVCGGMARAAPNPSPSLLLNALRYRQLRKLATVEATPSGKAFSLAALVPASGGSSGDAGDSLDAAVDASLNRRRPVALQEDAGVNGAEPPAATGEGDTASAEGSIHEPTVRALLASFEVEGSTDGVYYNEANDYGVLTLHLHTGDGDPWKLYLGDQVMGEFATGKRGTEWRGTGRYKLNEALVALVVDRLREQQRPE